MDPADGSVLADLGIGSQLDGSEHTRPVESLSFNNDGSLLVTASEDPTAVIWDTATYEVVHRLEGHAGAVLGASFDPSRNEVATASFDGTVRIWSLENGTSRLTLPIASGAGSDVAYSPDGRYLAVVSATPGS